MVSQQNNNPAGTSMDVDTTNSVYASNCKNSFLHLNNVSSGPDDDLQHNYRKSN